MVCCLPFFTSVKSALTAEALMRSRYSAYVFDQRKYLLNTWHQSTRPDSLDEKDTRPDKWLGLKIVNVEAGLEKDTQGIVEFIAKYKLNGKAYRLHEKSRFLRENDKWFYLNGEMID